MTSTGFFLDNDQGKFWKPVPVPQKSKTLSWNVPEKKTNIFEDKKNPL